MNEILEQLSSELEFNGHNLQDVLRKMPILYSKCLNKWYALANELDILEVSLGNRKNERYSYYRVDHQIELSSAEIKTFVDGDIELNDTRLKISSVKRKIELLEKMMKMIDDTRWAIKSYIDYENFKNGN